MKRMNRIQVRPKIKQENKTIGLIIPSTTKGQDVENVDDLIIFRILFSSFFKYSSNNHIYNFYVGYDHDDPFYGDEQNRNSVMKKFSDISSSIHSLTLVQFDKNIEKGDLSSMWSVLADRAVENCEYLYQLGDDIEFKSRGWENLFITKLSKMKNIGVVGPLDDNNNTILTQSFVHCTHLSFFGRYYPSELKNWYVDDWITEIYDGKIERGALVRNRGGAERYDIECIKKNKVSAVERDKKLVELIRKQTQNIIYIRNSKSQYWLLDKTLICSVKHNVSGSIQYEGEIDNDIIKQLVRGESRPEIYYPLMGKMVRKTTNHIMGELDGLRLVKNINNYDGGGEGDEGESDIFLIQQFFIPSEERRYGEVKECIRRNVKNTCFKKIYLLNERIYSAEEMGLKSIPVNMIQINIGKRMTFKDAFRFGKNLNGFIVLSNSDIFFDQSINNCKKLGMDKYPCVQSLCKYEYRGHTDLSKCPLNPNRTGSQDTWIIHSKYVTSAICADFLIGQPGCDLGTNKNIIDSNLMLLSDSHLIKTYHNHDEEDRNYSLKGTGHDHNGAGVKVYAEDYWGRYFFVYLAHHLFWQYPVITEKSFLVQNCRDSGYVDIPWATILDKNKCNMKKLASDINSIHGSEKRYTCCQHISFRKLIPVFKSIRIKKVYASHKIIGEDMIDGIKILPCPLYAKVVEDDREFFKDDGERKYLYSFQGAYQKDYMSNIRPRIFNMNHPDDTKIVNIGGWHYNKIVYSGKQNEKGEYNGDKKHYDREAEYKRILKSSRYTLCPSGSGPNSIRFWESLGAGSIPILLSDKLELPPHELWKETILRVEEKDVETIPSMLTEISSEREQNMRKNCYELYEFFRNNYKAKNII